jgi:hypothetical protein
MNTNHAYARKAARAIDAANAESNRPRKRRTTRVRYERPVLSEQSNWLAETHEYMGDGFAVSAQQRAREEGTRPFAGPAFSEVRTYNVRDIRPDGWR